MNYIFLNDAYDTCRSFIVIHFVKKDEKTFLQPWSQIRFVDTMIECVSKSG